MLVIVIILILVIIRLLFIIDDLEENLFLEQKHSVIIENLLKEALDNGNNTKEE